MWKLLHSMAERAGSSALQLDEKRAWISFLKFTEGVLPCAMCRQHYRDWRRSHPLEDFLGSHGEFFRDRVREWLWGLHDDVNARREVERLPIDGLAKYRDVSSKEIHDTLQGIVKILEKAVLHRQINVSYVAEWKKAVMLLRRL
jgi:hypothetical protein